MSHTKFKSIKLRYFENICSEVVKVQINYNYTMKILIFFRIFFMLVANSFQLIINYSKK